MISGTPTVPGSYSFDLLLSDPVSLQTCAINGFAITILPFPVAPPVFKTLPLAVHTFKFNRWYLSYETSPGVFNLAGVAYDGEEGSAATCSAGALTEAEVGKRGMVAGARSSPIAQYIGDGLPTPPITISASGIDTLRTPDYWDMSHGAWTYGDSKYLLIQAETSAFPSKPVLVMLKSTDEGATWTALDLANSPPKFSVSAMRRGIISNNLVDVFGYDDVVNISGHYALNTFDFDLDAWSGFYGQQNFSRVLQPGGNGIYRFPNDDIGIYYQDLASPHALWYREWNGASWGAEVSISASAVVSACANMYIDPAGEILHMFKYIQPIALQPVYFKITHGGTVSADIFVFPAGPGPTSDGVGNGMIFQAPGYTEPQIYAPYDNSADLGHNAVWIAPLSTGQFVKYLLPTPEGEEANVPSCAYMMFDSYPVVPTTAASMSLSYGLSVDFTPPIPASLSFGLGLKVGVGTPNLKLIKIVSNTRGGTAIPSDFTLNAAGPTPISGHGTVGPTPVKPGTYVLSESGPTGYTAGQWTCTGATVVNGVVTITAGETVVCTIHNNDTGGGGGHTPTPPTPNPPPCPDDPIAPPIIHVIPQGVTSADTAAADVLIFATQEPQEPTAF
jgi:hypothetical protein